MLTRMRIATAALALLFTAPAAQATPFQAFYAAGTGSITIDLDGTLAPDSNVITVLSVSGVQINDGGVSLAVFPTPLYVYAYSNVAPNSSGLAPTLSVDGSLLDFMVCDTANCTAPDFALAIADASWSPLQTPVVFVAFGGSSGGVPFVAAGWTVTGDAIPEGTTIPEPASAILLSIGLTGLAVARRRQARG